MRGFLSAVLVLFGQCVMAQTDVSKQHRDAIVKGYRVATLIITMNEGLSAFYPDKKQHNGFIGHFPIYEGNSYRLIYYTDLPEFKAIGTVIFDRVISFDSARIDKNVRDLTPLEHEAATMQLLTANDLVTDTSIHILPNSRQIVIPLISAYGRSVYVFNWPVNAKDCHFGNDLEYTFGAISDQIIGKRKIHKNLSSISSNDSVPVHRHYNEDISDIPVHDLASFYITSLYQGKKKFRIADENKVLEIDVAHHKIILFKHEEYKKSGSQISQLTGTDK